MPSGPALPGERKRARDWFRKGAAVSHIAREMGRPRKTIQDWTADLRQAKASQ